MLKLLANGVLLLLIGHADIGSSATEQGVLGPYASVPARYVIGLDTTGSTQDAAQDTGDRVFMTNKAGTKYDCRLPSSIPQTSTSDLSQEPDVADDESVAQVLDRLSARCFYRLEDWWTYELCYGQHVRQFHRDKETVTLEYSLGLYNKDKDSLERTQVLPASDAQASTYVHQTYQNGDDCEITGQTRQTEVRYSCIEGSKEVVLSIKEPSTCHYVLTVGIPGLCKHSSFKKQEEKLQHIVCAPVFLSEQAKEERMTRHNRTSMPLNNPEVANVASVHRPLKPTRAQRRGLQDQQVQLRTQRIAPQTLHQIQPCFSSATEVTKSAKLYDKLGKHSHTGQTWREQRLQGQTSADPPLNATGKLQAEAVASRLQSVPISVIYASDLQRTMQTASIVAHVLQSQVVPVKKLRERHLGVLEGLTRHEAAEQHPEAFANLSTSPDIRIQGGGESQNDVAQRVSQSINNIASQHPGQTVLVVIHGGVLNACYRHAMGCSYPGKHVNAAINTIKIEEERWAVVSWNNTDHLSTTGYLASAFGGGSGGG